MLNALVKAARLRTLPLAIAAIALGSIVSGYFNLHHWGITILAILTAVFLQILSNFANDYGDFKKGVDEKRSDRAMASGDLTLKQMQVAMTVLGACSLVSGVCLLLLSFESINFNMVIFFLIGLICIGAAVYYTAGKNPYGYRGYGDLAVFIFFGLISVSGVYYLQHPVIDRAFYLGLLPASAFGLLSTGVLNINNMRDIQNDKVMNKITLAVMLGSTKAVFYQLALILSSFLLIGVFFTKGGETSGLSVMLILPIYIWHWFRLKMLNHLPEERPKYNVLLKQMVLLNAFLVLIFGLILLF